MATALPERNPRTEQGPVLSPKATRCGESNAEGKRLVEQMLQDAALPQATEQGYKDFQEGRFSKLEDVKRRLGDV